jgi:uncharacterized protein YdhG (YjbR/CyaY superfamily)
MQSTAKDVAAYIEEAPAERQPWLQQLRTMCLQTLAGYEEVMEYGMPVYKKDGGGIAFANQKQYISLYVHKEVLDAHRDQLAGLSVGKSCIRYTKPAKIDFAVVQRMLDATLLSTGEFCP